MLTTVVFLLIAVAIGPSLAIDCSTVPDGSYDGGCHSYTRCQGGVGTVIDCEIPGWAYDWRSGQCERWITVPPPCGAIGNDCTGYDNAKYPVMPNCTYFYTCQDQQFFGANPCNPPGPELLVFDYEEQSCNWRDLTARPCGNAEPVPANKKK